MDTPALEPPDLAGEDPLHRFLEGGGLGQRQDIPGTPADDVLAPPAKARDPGAGHHLVAQVLAEDHERGVRKGVGERPVGRLLDGRWRGPGPDNRHRHLVAVVRHVLALMA